MSLQNCNIPSDDANGVVRIVEKTADPFHGLTGHAYIQARNLNRPVQRVQTSAHTELATTGQVQK